MIPTFPADATIMSIHLACLRAGRSLTLRSSTRAFYGTDVNIHNRFGHKAKTFAKRALADHLTAEELIERHSMFPFFSSLMTLEAASRWREALAEGHPDAYHRYLRATRYGVQTQEHLRHCPDCVQEDTEAYGIAHWHVIHQMPAIRFCSVHDRRLHNQCANCGAALGGASVWQMPGDACAECGSSNTSSTLINESSEGYRAYVALTKRIVEGDAYEVAPGTRTLLLRHVINTADSDPSMLLARFLAWWNVDDLQALEVLLQSPINSASALQLFKDGHASVSTPFLIAALAFACEHTTELDRIQLMQHQSIESDMFSANTVKACAGDLLRDELAVLVRRHHLSGRALEFLCLGDRQSANEVVGGTNVFLLLDGLTSEARLQLNSRVQQHREDSARKPKKGNSGRFVKRIKISDD